MKGENPRGVAARILLRITRHGESLDRALADHEPLVKTEDRGLLRELCYGTLRWHVRLDRILKQLMSRPLRQSDQDIHQLILVGLYQLSWLRIPPHAAVHETVQAAQGLHKAWAKKLVNGVLRNYQRRGDSLQKTADGQPATRYAYPPWLVNRLTEAWPQHWEELLHQGNQPGPMTLRVNLSRISREDYLARLQARGIDAQFCNLAAAGIRLASPVDIGKLPGFPEGLASIQDEAAQLCVSVLDPRPGSRILDACAAPGGKTGAILEKVDGDAELLALDISGPRCQRIRDNLDRLQLEAQIKPADAGKPDTWWDGRRFDCILLDAPCSGSGVIRRHPDIKLLRRSRDMAGYHRQQRSLLEALWPLLKEGGVLVYATCSLLPEENHRLVREFLDDHADALESPLTLPGALAVSPGVQLFPQPDGGDGFYYARIIKR